MTEDGERMKVTGCKSGSRHTGALASFIFFVRSCQSAEEVHTGKYAKMRILAQAWSDPSCTLTPAHSCRCRACR